MSGLPRKTILLVTILVFIGQFLALGQQKRSDSLLIALNKEQSDSAKAILLSELCWEYGFDNKARAVEIGEKALDLAKKIKNAYAEACAYNTLGTAYLRSGDYDHALEELELCLAIREKLNNERDLASVLSKIGLVYTQKGDYKKGIEVNIRALSIFEKLGDTDPVCMMLINIGDLYESMKQYAKADEYYLKVYDVAVKSKNREILAVAHQSLARLAERGGNYQKAIEHYLKSANVYKEINNKENYSAALNNVGFLYRQIGNDQKGLEYYQMALKASEEIGDQHGVAFYLSNLGNVYAEMRYYEEALSFQNKAFTIAKNAGIKPLMKDCYSRMADIYARQGDYKQAYAYHELFSQMNDSLLNEESTNQIAEMQTKYESEKKDNENRTLQQQNAIKTLEIENNAEKIKIRNQTIFILAAVILVVLVVVFWQISLVRIRKEKRELETEKKLQLDRERISRDLHDNVGGQLSYVLFSLEGKEDPTPEKRKEKAAALAGAVRNVTGNLRETIWALNQEDLTLKDLSDKLKLYARNIFAYTDVKVRFEEDITKAELLNPSTALNLYRIVQEGLNNAFKHAKAAEVRITISDRDKTSVTISDNGVGFSIEKGQGEKYGLSNLERRASEIAAKLSIETSPGSGTTLVIVV